MSHGSKKSRRQGSKLNKAQNRMKSIETGALQFAASEKARAETMVLRAGDAMNDMKDVMEKLREAVPAAEKLAAVRKLGRWGRFWWAWGWAKRGTV